MSAVRVFLATLVAVALGAWIWFYERPAMLAEGGPDKLIVFEVDDIDSVELSYPDGRDLQVRRRDGQWRMVKPVDYPADPEAVTNLIKAIADLELERRLPAGDTEDLGEYGLAPRGETVTVALGTRSGRSLPAIEVGRTTPVGFSAFVRLADSREVALVPLLFHTGVRKEAFDLRDKRVLPEARPELVRAVRVAHADNTMRLVRERDHWQLAEPIEDSADARSVEALLRTIESVAAIQFLDEAAADEAVMGFQTPRLVLDVELEGGRSTGLVVGNANPDNPPGYFVRRTDDGQVFKVGEESAVRLAESPAAYRDRHLLRCDFDSLVRVRFADSRRGTFTLQRNAPGQPWTIDPAIEGVTVRAPAVERLLGGMAAMEAEQIVRDDVGDSETRTVYGLDRPVVEVVAVQAGDKTCETLLAATTAAEDPDPRWYFLRSDEPTLLEAGNHVFSRIDVVMSDLVEAPPDVRVLPAGAPAQAEAPGPPRQP